jgi:uncharacterized tellurite resistance protein B-like protein
MNVIAVIGRVVFSSLYVLFALTAGAMGSRFANEFFGAVAAFVASIGITALFVFIYFKKARKFINAVFNTQANVLRPSVKSNNEAWHHPTVDKPELAEPSESVTGTIAAEPKFENGFSKTEPIADVRKKEAAGAPPLNAPEPDFAQEAYETAMADRYINVPENENIYRLEYEDADGDISRRDIKVIRIGNEDGRWYVYAYCYLREDYRQFRFDRIDSLSLNGNPITEPQKYLFDLYFNSPEYKLGMLFETKSEELALLVFMARADGSMRKNEREAVAEYIKSVSDVTDSNAIHEAVKALRVDLPVFNKTLRNAKRWPDNRRATVLCNVEKVYAAKKSHDPIEEGTFKKIQDALKVK